ncbi:ATP-binding protein [Rhodoferax sp. U2-2l]|uniref:HD domain-containing protein n=1 Tax=Rhodoferax sp. U2-2l TaxID=2884000 RepID=UPI001D0A61DF|nr:ATP-binding protein [Rhodoferax sp. U2-2l]MCB8749054.1 ATP-binding protein [Rhodoferax sp. U2-2l]
MNEFSVTVSKSDIWRTSLASIDHDPHESERERLRSSFIGFRHRASQLATEIGKDLPDLTIHDITHLDALWEVASQITGADYPITPTEAYVLGGAFLLHDLAMSLAATPGGFKALKADSRWRDLVFSAYADRNTGPPTEAQVDNPDECIRHRIIFDLLRQLHAENAEKLAFLAFDKNASTPQYLIEDTELRQTFGRLIGQIAHSHWWSIGEVERTFDKTVGAPHWAPTGWTIDPLKLACILRASDASHVDARRAPTFQKSFAGIGPASIAHWTFQERINKAYVRDGALVYTSGLAFSLADARAWWLCLDTLRMIDKELRQIDSLLSDRAMPRFNARRVAGVDAPERLAKYIQTTDWHPINAIVQISDLPNIIRSLGGEELYGKRPRVPLRELIQNASDAIRARRHYEERPSDFGEIKVALTYEDSVHTLRVEDNGVGMSRRVLTEFLLDFGNSFWAKPQVQEEFPGLLSSGFRATGRYGIGFFSVFMAADKVTVVTRRPDAAAKDTLVLEFGSGLEGRPILRPATKVEQLRDGGTVISLRLKIPPGETGGILSTWGDKPPLTLVEACRQIAPALDAKLTVETSTGIIVACNTNDWITVEGIELLRRLEPFDPDKQIGPDQFEKFAGTAASNLRFLTTENGSIVGRAAVTAAGLHSYRLREPWLRGTLCVGGFAASPLQGIAGVILGESTKAARDSACPIVAPDVLSSWANEQAGLLPNLYSAPEALASAAEIVRLCGGDTGLLPIAIHRGKWVSTLDIRNMDLSDVVLVVDHFVKDTELKHEDDFIADDNVLFTSSSGTVVVFQGSDRVMEYGGSGVTANNGLPRNLCGAVLESIAGVWGIDPNSLAKQVDAGKERDVRIGVSAQGRVIRSQALVIHRNKAVPKVSQ